MKMSASRIALLLLLAFTLQVSGVAMVCAPRPCCMGAVSQDDCGEMQMDVADCPMCDQVAKAPQPTVALQAAGKWSVARIESVPVGVVSVEAAASFTPTLMAVHRTPLTTVLRI